PSWLARPDLLVRLAMEFEPRLIVVRSVEVDITVDEDALASNRLSRPVHVIEAVHLAALGHQDPNVRVIVRGAELHHPAAEGTEVQAPGGRPVHHERHGETKRAREPMPYPLKRIFA